MTGQGASFNTRWEVLPIKKRRIFCAGDRPAQRRLTYLENGA